MPSKKKADDEPSGSRAPRSRVDRPCDACRRYKHLCIIPVREEPCVGCKTRSKPCTFEMPPLVRKRKRAEGSVDRQSGSGNASPRTVAETNGHGPTTLAPMSRDVPWTNMPPLTSGPIPPDPTTSSWLHGLADQASQMQSSMPYQQPVHHTPVTAVPHLSASSSHTSPHDALHQAAGAGGIPFSSHTTPQVINEHPPSPKLPPLDHDTDEQQESHFLGAMAYSSFTVKEAAGHPVQPYPGPGPTGSEIPFRQVSSDVRTPVFFVKNPALLYGRTTNSGKSVFDAVCRYYAGSEGEILSKALTKLRQCTLPAVPFINFERLETACLGLEGNRPVPYGLLAGVIAHCSAFIPEIRHLNTELWSCALQGLDDEYRLPRLMTLQFALLQLCSRPQERGQNTGQVEIAIARAVGTANLLGLHMDPTNWTLPVWERRLRKRIYWILFNFDRLKALLFGRPRFIHMGDHRVSLPTMDDGDWGQHASPGERLSLEAFCATCRLSLLIDKIIENFSRVQAVMEPLSEIARITLLEEYLVELDQLEYSLSPPLQFRLASDSLLSTLPTGVRSLQLAYLGIRATTHRLLLDVVPPHSALRNAHVLQGAFVACQHVVRLTQMLRPDDTDKYWCPTSALHFFNVVSLLLRILIRARAASVTLPFDVYATLKSYLEALGAIRGVDRWEIAGVALRKSAALLTMVEKEYPESGELYDVVARILALPARPTNDDDSADFLASLGLQDLDPSIWPGNDMFWMGDMGSVWDHSGGMAM